MFNFLNVHIAETKLYILGNFYISSLLLFPAGL